jgi:hypothetical protein
MNRTILVIGIIFLLIGVSVVSSKTNECTLVENTKEIESTALTIPFEYQLLYESHDPIYILGNNDLLVKMVL